MLHDNEMINIEEDMILSPGYLIRRFTLHNRINQLRLSITNLGATVISCKVNHGKDEVIRHSENTLPDNACTSRNNGYEWQSHVLGLDTLLLATSHHHTSAITYQLTTDDELVISGKLRNFNHLNYFIPFYFNLNCESDTGNVEGHLLHVKAVNRNCPMASPLPLHACGTHELAGKFCGYSPSRIEIQSLKTAQELMYYTPTNLSAAEVAIVAILEYGAKKLEVRLHSNVSSNSSSSSGSTSTNSFNNSSMQSSATNLISSSTTFACASSSTSSGFVSSISSGSSLCSSSAPSSSFGSLASSSSSGNSNLLSSPASMSAVACKLKVRISRYGVALLPTYMTDFKCVYKFTY